MADRPTMGVEVNIRSDSSSANQTSLSTPTQHPAQTPVDSPFCIAIMGDFSGHTSATDKPRLIEIDRDNLEEVMGRFKINLQLSLSNNDNIQIELNELDDFQPDELYEKLESFEKLRSLRRRLKSNSSFADAAAEIQSWFPKKNADADLHDKPVNAPATSDAIPATDNLLDSILGSSQTSTQATSSAAVEATQIDRLIKSIVAPYVEPAADPRQDEMLEMVDRATAAHMREILHHPSFQAMESAWQSLYFLVKRLDTGKKLKLFLFDISKQEFQRDLAVDDLSTSSIHKLFCDPSEGDNPWSILLGNYTFTDSIDDALSLANIGAIAQQSNATFIAGAHEKLAGCEAFAKTADYEDWNYSISDGTSQAWDLLRKSPVASYIGLALPRFLLRLPYGNKSKPIDAFKFEEMIANNNNDNHNHYLWGNAAFIKVECLAQNFCKNHWDMQPGEVFQTDNLPVHYYSDEGETVNKPIAEIMLTEKGGEILNQHGLIPLWSVRNMDCIRSADYRSININAEKIKGRWK